MMTVVIKLADKEIILNKDLLKFDEHTINQFLQEFSSNYDSYCTHHADAQYIRSRFEDNYDAIYAERFLFHRGESTSDKTAEMKTKADKDVQDALEKVRISKRNESVIWGFLRSMDKSHDDALNFCYNLRKEMDKLSKDMIKY